MSGKGALIKKMRPDEDDQFKKQTPISERGTLDKSGFQGGVVGLNKVSGGGGFSSVRERFENTANTGNMTPLYDSNAQEGMNNMANRSKSKWTSGNGFANMGTGNRKSSNSHVGNPMSPDTSSHVTPRLNNNLNLIGNKSKLHSL